MKPRCALAMMVIAFAITVKGQAAPDAREITKMLNDFLAATNDPAMHERFWAEDLIYTRSAGGRVSKADILRDMRSAGAPKPGDPKTAYSAEDVRIQQYGDTAILAFRLVSTTTSADGLQQVANFLNSGTFLKRGGKWQVVSWQATRAARPEEASKKELTAARATLFQSVLAGDAKTVTALTDPTFIWTHTNGHQTTLAQLIADLSSGVLKYSRLESSKESINVYGNTAVIRGESIRQRSSIPDTPGKGDAQPFTAFYTITFVNQTGAWKAVAMHTSRSDK